MTQITAAHRPRLAGLVFGSIVLSATSAFAVEWSPVAADGVTPIDNVLEHTAGIAWTNTGPGGGGFSAESYDATSLTHVVLQSGGSSSFASTSAVFTTSNSAGLQPAKLLLSLPFGSPFRGVRANAQTTAELLQVSIAGNLHSATIAPGALPTDDAEQGAWRFRLEPTGSEIAGESVRISAFASIEGQVNASASPTAASRILADFTINGQSIISNETIADDTEPANAVDESRGVFIPAALGDVIEIELLVRTDATVVGAGPRQATADVTSLRHRIEIRLIRELADLNYDGVIDTADLGILIANFGLTGTNYDINADGVIDTADIGLLISVFGMASL